MRVVVVGAGAVGGWYGGRLAERGQEVHLVTRSDAATIARDGLTLRDRQGDRKVKVASAQPTTDGLGPCDFAIVAAKATANPTLPAQLRPLLNLRRAHLGGIQS